MSTSAGTVTGGRRGSTASRPQWLAVALSVVRHVVVDLMMGLAVVTGLAVVGLLLLWYFVAREASDGGMWGGDPLVFMLVMGAAIVALVLGLGGLMVLVTAVSGYTKAWVAAGATRRSVWAGHWAGVLTVLALWGAALAVAQLVGRDAGSSYSSDTVSWSLPDTLGAGDVLGPLAILLTVLVATMLFVRFGAAVGLVVLALWLVALPMVLAVAPVPDVVAAVLWPPFSVGPGRSEALGGAENLFTDLAQVLLLAVAHWLLVRRLPVA